MSYNDNIIFKKIKKLKHVLIIMIKIIINSKFNLYIPQKTDILIADKKSGKEAINLFFHQYKCEYLHTRLDEINIYVLIITLIKYKFKELSKNYIKCMIEIREPKIIFCLHENNWALYKTKYKKYKYKLIIAQMAVMYGESCNYYYENKDKLFACDYFLNHSKHSKQFLGELIDTKYLNVGSFKLNSYLADLPDQGDTGVCFISQYRGGKGINTVKNPVMKKPIEYAYKLVSKICKDYNIILSIALASSRIDKTFEKKKEIKFYKDIYHDFKYSDESSYKFAIKSNTIVCMNSTLGLELVSIGYKVLFLDTLISLARKSNTLEKHTYKENEKKYNRPDKPVRFSNYFSYYYGNDGEFWDEGIEHKNVEEKINKLYKMDGKEWRSIYKKYTLPIQYFDSNNSKLKEIIDGHISDYISVK